MKATYATVLIASGALSLASSAPRSSHLTPSLLKRSSYDLCQHNCALSNTPVPDSHTFQLPLENNWSEQCPPTIIGDWHSPTAASTVCLNFVGTDLTFTFAPFLGDSQGAHGTKGYTYRSATVNWKLRGNTLDRTTWTPPPPPGNTTITCSPDVNTIGDYVCKLPFADILGLPHTTDLNTLLAGMCPNGDKEALGLFLSFAGEVVSMDFGGGGGGGGGDVMGFRQQYPCKGRDKEGKCTEWDGRHEVFGLSWRCSRCGVAPCS